MPVTGISMASSSCGAAPSVISTKARPPRTPGSMPRIFTARPPNLSGDKLTNRKSVRKKQAPPSRSDAVALCRFLILWSFEAPKRQFLRVAIFSAAIQPEVLVARGQDFAQLFTGGKLVFVFALSLTVDPDVLRDRYCEQLGLFARCECPDCADDYRVRGTVRSRRET